MYSPVTSVRPEEALLQMGQMQQAAAAGFFVNPLDLSALNQVPPMNYPTASTVANVSRENISFTSAGSKQTTVIVAATSTASLSDWTGLRTVVAVSVDLFLFQSVLGAAAI